MYGSVKYKVQGYFWRIKYESNVISKCLSFNEIFTDNVEAQGLKIKFKSND
jgi:hypothetical protein